ncbi:MAG: hypothetical protein KF781_02270 [Chitinophagaceae bacterium]|nr:hypothetical protein [Chitinophagaceae bacterium]MCW5904335.1 hypothetical protein [Chitinophagaceae bacterium]
MAQDKTYPIKTTAKPEHLKTYEVSEEDGKINLLFTKKGKKHEVYTNYVFDKDLNLIIETEEELDVEQVKKKKNYWGSSWAYIAGYGSIGGIIRDSVLSVDNNMLGQLVLMTGYIGWTSRRNPMNGMNITDQGFISREKIRVKDDKTGRKLTMVGFKTDAPSEFFIAGREISHMAGSSSGRSKGLGAQKRVSSASGDVMVVSVINTMGLKDEATGERIYGNNIRFVAQRYSAKTLEKIAETPFEFKYSYAKLYDQPSTDNSNDMLLIFAPTHGDTKPYHNPNKNEYEYFRVGVDAKIKERIKFISPYGRLNNLYIYNFGDETVIIGTSKEGKESKYADFIAFKGNDDHLVSIRLKNGQEPVVKATPMKSLGLDISYLVFNDAIKTADNQVWITGQAYEKKGNDPEKWGDIYAFNITADGSIAKHFVLPQIEKKSQQGASPVSLTKLNDGSLLWSAYEYTKKGNMYPKYTTISNGNLGTVVFPGDKKYVVNDVFQMYISPNGKELIYFGNTEDNKEFWLHKKTF